MSAENIEMDYAAFEGIISRLGEHSNNSQTTMQDIRSRVETLLNHGWKGIDADDFRAEMDSVLPRLERLCSALENLVQASRNIYTTVESADDTARNCFTRLAGRN